MRTKAKALDAQDPLKDLRDRFALSPGQIYLCNNSLGLPAKNVSKAMQEQVLNWEKLGVEGWFDAKSAWYTYFRDHLNKPLAKILGAQNDEVIVMNSLTINLHLLMVSFYQPTSKRYKILTDAPMFPSDLYALQSQLKLHGYDPEEALLVVDDVTKTLDQQGESIALVMINGVNFLTGKLQDIEKITQKAHEQGCTLGCDLAHAAGNIPLELHEWKVDFAVGCSYKYLCGGPGAPGIAFVHSKHHHHDLPRLNGWWGNDPNKRFQMQLQPEFVPFGGAASWQLSTPSILAMTPLAQSLAIYAKAGMERIRIKSIKQTEFLFELLEDRFEILTPRAESLRGAQLSLVVENAEAYVANLAKQGVVCDFRPPNVMRVTPSALYNTFEDLVDFVELLF